MTSETDKMPDVIWAARNESAGTYWVRERHEAFDHLDSLKQKKYIREDLVIKNSAANEKQIDGTHYKDLHIQPWEIIERNNLNFWEGNAIKYILRWRKKAGVNDLKKAIHYLEKQIEIEENKQKEN